jgi:uncharacterized membrane protein
MTWLKHILQGRWLGHPLHPAIVHIPLGLWPATLVFDLISRFGYGGNAAVRISFACIAGGLLAALVAIPTGLADFAEIKPGKPARRIGVIHMLLNLLVTGLFGINLLLRRGNWHASASVSSSELALSAVGVALLAISGFLGGRMTYEYGIGVGRMSRDKWRRLAEAGHANLPPAKEQ